MRWESVCRYVEERERRCDGRIIRLTSVYREREKVGKNCLVTRERSGRLIQIRFERGNYILLLLPKKSWNIVREPDTA